MVAYLFLKQYDLKDWSWYHTPNPSTPETETVQEQPGLHRDSGPACVTQQDSQKKQKQNPTLHNMTDASF